MHPRSMSIPITCAPHRQDPLFHVLYGANEGYIRGLVEESVISVSRQYPTQGVREALHLMRPAPGDSLDKLRARFFMLLNEDEGMRRELGAPPRKGSPMTSLCQHKARRFYDELCDDILPGFTHNETVRLSELVDQLRAAYLQA